MKRALPPLNAIRAFEAAARHESFTRAAEELGMTQAAVSYQIKLLEERLGAALFRRLPRRVELSAEGRRALPLVTEAFDTLAEAFSTVLDERNPVLSITTLQTLAVRWLVPRLGAFQLAHPEIAVRLDASNRLLDFDRDDIDVAIRSGSGEWPGTVAHRLFPIDFTVAVSPALLARHGPLESPADVLRLPLVSPTDPWWRLWFAAAGLPDAETDGRRALSLGVQQLDATAVLAGAGAGLLSPLYFREELRDGRLVQPFPIVALEPNRFYWLVYPKARRNAPKVRAFRDWVLAQIGESEAERNTVPTIYPQ
ncbi:transcriptional regulator GcvA [Segnochrobactrum spirostomi]|uniref:Transcriptional regulator GcvA n=1 Tax=Segnochrobactrum spirostomi TaxID=2608987 RepID=A0A6A7Y1J1_9HYPH|nr:transcriptional regulator GcvA [Segnochrobactrum spirostomi]MQT12247.1 transcriptional regulator GcvA [Segnochrobactrum spirostomi]